MLRVSPGDGGSFFNADKRKKQVTLIDPASGQSSSAEDRRPTVAAPKMFAFDAIFTEEDSQVDSQNREDARGHRAESNQDTLPRD